MIVNFERTRISELIEGILKGIEEPFDVALVIGRMQPYQLAHEELVDLGLSIAKQVGVILGSAFRAPDHKNPLRALQREETIRLCHSETENAQLQFIHMRDYFDDPTWVRAVREAVQKQFPFARRIALVGHFKDASSYYLSRFPEWTLVEKQSLREGLSATHVRNVLFSQDASWPTQRAMLKAMVPPAVLEYLSLWRQQPVFQRLREDYAAWLRENETWDINPPYPIQLLCADSVVRCNDHFLVVERGLAPGKGLIANAGGHVEFYQTAMQASLAELAQETNLDLLGCNVEASLVAVKNFDHPGRSSRLLRTFTVVHYYDLGWRKEMPVVHPGSDAKRAFWLPDSEVDAFEEMFFEDHHLMVKAAPAHRQPRP